MLARGIEMTRLVVLTNGSGMSVGLHGRGLGGGESSWIGDDPGYGARGGRERRGEERPTALALASFEVAVRGADAVLPGLELVAVHGDAHRAARLAPLGAGRLEDFVEAFALGLLLDLLAAGDDQDSETGRDVPAPQDRRRRAHVLDPAVGARPDKDDVELLTGDRRARLESHVSERPLEVRPEARFDVG